MWNSHKPSKPNPRKRRNLNQLLAATGRTLTKKHPRRTRYVRDPAQALAQRRMHAVFLGDAASILSTPR